MGNHPHFMWGLHSRIFAFTLTRLPTIDHWWGGRNGAVALIIQRGTIKFTFYTNESYLTLQIIARNNCKAQMKRATLQKPCVCKRRANKQTSGCAATQQYVYVIECLRVELWLANCIITYRLLSPRNDTHCWSIRMISDAIYSREDMVCWHFVPLFRPRRLDQDMTCTGSYIMHIFS